MTPTRTACLLSSTITLLGCDREDKDLLLTTTDSAIAVGALYSFTASDACRSARFSGCSSDKLVEWKNLESSDPKVVKPREVENLPDNLRIDGYPWVLEGMSPGSASVTDDGRRSR